MNRHTADDVGALAQTDTVNRETVLFHKIHFKKSEYFIQTSPVSVSVSHGSPRRE